MPRFRLFAASAALVLIPSLGIGQGVTPAPKTYTVKKGDTLWGISQQFFSDPFLWPELYRANTGIIQDPHWIYPGQVLRIPDVAAMQRTPDEVVRPVTPPSQQPATLTVTPPSKRPTTGSMAPVPRTAVRSAEYLTSPFVGPDGGPALSGQILRWANGNAGLEHPETRLLQRFDLTVIRPPAGVRAVKGDRFLAYRLGVHVGIPNGQLVEPLGIVQIDDAANGNEVIASVRALFGDLRVGDGLIPLDTLVARTEVYPTAIEPVLTATILWIQDKPLLPTIGSYLVFNAAAIDGVATGDQITLVRERGLDSKGLKLPDEILGVAQILRVTPFGSSAVLIRVNADGIGVGTLGRLTARMMP
jgi:LysM repeat protein